MSAETHSLSTKKRPGQSTTDGRGMRIGIAYTKWNEKIVGALVAGCKKELTRLGVGDSDIELVEVPGSYELVFAARTLIKSRKRNFDVIVCVGCLIKGETMHFEYICEAVTQGIMRVQQDLDVPVIFGVLACLTEEQALLRAGFDTDSGKGHNHGLDWGAAAVEMSALRRKYA